jgi:hypothetical protein
MIGLRLLTPVFQMSNRITAQSSHIRQLADAQTAALAPEAEVGKTMASYSRLPTSL